MADDFGIANVVRTHVTEHRLVVHEDQFFQPKPTAEYLSRLGIIPIFEREIESDGADLVCTYAANGSIELDQVVSSREVEGVVLVVKMECFEQDGPTCSKNGKTAMWYCLYNLGSFLFYLFVCSDDSPALLSDGLGHHG